MTVPSDSMVDARTYVLDTSVLLADPQALQRFDEHAVVLPIVVLMELEGKRNDPELGWGALGYCRLRCDQGQACPAGTTCQRSWPASYCR